MQGFLCILALCIWSDTSAFDLSNEVSQHPSRRHNGVQSFLQGAAAAAVAGVIVEALTSPCTHCYHCKCRNWSDECWWCSRQNCNVDCNAAYNQNGQWSQWNQWKSVCSVTCGGGVKTRARSCDNPKPANEGKDCEGPTRQMVTCNTQACPTSVPAHWSEWDSYGPCSASCGKGTRHKYRACVGGLNCDGSYYQLDPCHSLKSCPTPRASVHATARVHVSTPAAVTTKVSTPVHVTTPVPVTTILSTPTPVQVTTPVPVTTTLSIPTPVHVTTPVPVHKITCLDTYPSCSTLGKSVCSGGSLNTLWSKKYCAAYCGFCGKTVTSPPTTATTRVPCVNKYPNCKSLSRVVCTEPTNAIWSRQYCQAYCGFCTH